jgi:hypothetical protein
MITAKKARSLSNSKEENAFTTLKQVDRYLYTQAARGYINAILDVKGALAIRLVKSLRKGKFRVFVTENTDIGYGTHSKVPVTPTTKKLPKLNSKKVYQVDVEW